ncbi:MAG: phytanoyl-CoA dioxygenase family protein [Acidobacteria bacterium]|nr:phytanoyl-CoA dioxygenase family protein [Acidobacteriota bacterium]
MSDLDQASVDEILARADELGASGCWDDALDLVSTAYEEHSAARFVCHLARLRYLAGMAQLESSKPTATPEGVDDPLPIGASGLPSASLDTLSAGTLRGSIQRHGCVHVPGAIGEADVAALVALTDQSIAAQQRWTGAVPAQGPSPLWHPLKLPKREAVSLGRKWVAGGGGVLLSDAPLALAMLLSLYHRIGVHSLVSDYLGARPLLSANKNTLRRVALDAVGGWHQDGAFLGADIRAINIWLALTPCGVDAPGLDIVPRRFEEIVPTGGTGSYFDWAVADADVASAAGDVGIVRPEFGAGDLLIFDEMCLHRTAVEPEMTLERHAIESWSFAPSAYPNGQVPLLW